MDLITLNTSMQGDKLIENYDSLAWSERFNTTGDFQLVTGKVEEFMELLPEGKIVSLRDSNVPMIVETHQIDRKKKTGAKLIIKGRSFESILDRRISINGVTAALGDWLVVAKLPSDVAHYIIYQICVVGIADVNDIFPPEVVQFITPTDYLSTSGPFREYSVPRGNLLSTVLGLLQTEADADPSTDPDTPAVVPHGIKSMRPDENGSAIGVQIYSGTDRSGTVYFDGTRDLLNDGTYLFSKVGSANVGYVLGPTTSAKMHQGAAVPSGLERRVILVDGTSSGIESDEALRAEGSRGLSQAHITAMFNGSVNQDLSPYTYGVDYSLGDIVKVVGDYGLEEKARVTEYIRTEDNTGNKAFPTLSAIPE